ncbi:hypothetical protein B0A55_11991 [Friedmanniomyces simplex]|uniref:Uncharacterized protein n=1 Tax=Friedmanniomyces simplex TaxID=329884 RepID=A0A4V5NFA8_9PEZI|nr:hypothetical protein B0A55_11991 [Friedmanniomyces simplex]
MENLIFITSHTSSIPNGRNARTHARAERARLSNPPKEQKGQFHVLDLEIPSQSSSGKQHRGRKRARGHTFPELAGKHPATARQHNRTQHCGPLASFGLLRSVWKAARSRDFEDVLAIAAHHIRRNAAHIAYTQPWRLAETLRRRQWAIAPFGFAQLHAASEPVTSAYAFLVMRLHNVVFDRRTTALVLEANEWALRNLRSALLVPKCPGRQDLDLVPASWLLALGELLDFQDSSTWSTHAAGTTALLRTGIPSGRHATCTGSSLSRLTPALLEAFLNHEEVVIANEPWQAVIRTMITSRICDGALAEFVASRLITTAALIAESKALEQEHPHSALRLFLLYRAMDARESLKLAVLKLQLQGQGDTEVLGLCLAALLGLDKVITSLQQGPQPDIGIDEKTHEEDTVQLCAQIMHDELERSDAFPDASLLLSFKRHGALSVAVPPAAIRKRP